MLSQQCLPITSRLYQLSSLSTSLHHRVGCLRALCLSESVPREGGLLNYAWHDSARNPLQRTPVHRVRCHCSLFELCVQLRKHLPKGMLMREVGRIPRA
jgi:hypothetical protein